MTSLILSTLGVALAGVGVLILRARQTRVQGGDAIRLVTSRYLGAKRFLTIVEVDGERLLLGLAGDNVSLVARLDCGEGGGESRRRPSEHGAAGAARTGAVPLDEAVTGGESRRRPSEHGAAGAARTGASGPWEGETHA